MKNLEERAMEKLGISNSDIQKHLKLGVIVYENVDEYIQSFIDALDDDEEYFDKIREAYDKAKNDTHNFINDSDVVFIDGKKYIIEYSS